MSKKNTFEDLHIGQTVNIIGKESFPQSFPMHWHKYAEIIVYTDNADTDKSPIINVNQKPYAMEPGDVLLIWPGEPHEVTSNSSRQMMGFQFPVSIFNEIPDFAPYLNMLRTYRHIKSSEYPELSQNLSMYTQHIYDIKKSDSLFPTVEMIICLYEMFMDLGRHVHTQVSPMADKALEKIDYACTYIQENCDSDISLDTVANHIGFSTCYFSRLFKQTTHYSFVDFLNLQRVKLAQQYLIDSSLNVTEVSYRAGFKSISTFNRVFRQCRGCSPSEYRKYYTDEIR